MSHSTGLSRSLKVSQGPSKSTKLHTNRLDNETVLKKTCANSAYALRSSHVCCSKYGLQISFFNPEVGCKSNLQSRKWIVN